MTVILDCNILVMCLTSRSPYHIIYKSFVSGKFELIITTDILLEYEEIIQQKYGTPTAKSFIALLGELPNVHFVTSYYHWQLITTDPDDNKYCDAAVAGRADYILSEDKHFDILQNISFPPLSIISIDAFSITLVFPSYF
ncbi:MAG: putative toxin-antitoxin system toxin component, PIN family [Chitinophagaceae bacterium]|nr:putative toxin-antitoxin system toxin component, PIN family [Chitinophagaceae bacterium]